MKILRVRYDVRITFLEHSPKVGISISKNNIFIFCSMFDYKFMTSRNRICNKRIFIYFFLRLTNCLLHRHNFVKRLRNINISKLKLYFRCRCQMAITYMFYVRVIQLLLRQIGSWSAAIDKEESSNIYLQLLLAWRKHALVPTLKFIIFSIAPVMAVDIWASLS